MIIVITYPVTLKDEHEIIQELFNEGLEILHLRKKEYSGNEMKMFIENIPEKYYQRIVLHSHYYLAEEYNLKGIHVPYIFNGETFGKSLSISFHIPEEIQAAKIPFDYGFLSPIFDSISKEGYRSGFDLNKIRQFMENRPEKIIALGGVDEDKIEMIKELRFTGIALLGAIWHNESPVEKYKRIKEKWQKQINCT
jgi:thiamine monophosphate synthase